LPNIACAHCSLEFDKASLIEDKNDEQTRYFCCSGCQGVYNLLKSEGLDDFYDKTRNSTLQPPKEKLSDTAQFDSKSYQDRYVTIKDGLHEVSLVIEGIHCSACVWLNEKVLYNRDGIVKANINFTTHKAKILYDPDQIKLSEVIETIRSIGYDAFAYDSAIQEKKANKERSTYYTRMAVAIFATMNIMWIAVAQYGGYFSSMEEDVRNMLNIAEWILATPVLFYSGWIFFRGAFYGIKNTIVNMDVLVSSGALLTYLYSIYITVRQEGEAYFDSVAMIITFVLIGKFLEVLSKKRAVDRLDSMGSDMPLEAQVIRGDEVISLAVDEIVVGDVVELKSGQRASVDGFIIKGEGSFDEATLTGESRPIFKSSDSIVLGGTLLVDGWLRYRVSKSFSESTMSKLLGLLDSALEHKPRIETLANRLAEHFSSAILILALLTFSIWFMVTSDFEDSFIVGISVVIIACPCALALATPLATLVGLALGTKKGILFKEARYLETMAHIDTVVFDKTGTLTEGKPVVIDVKEHASYDKKWLNSLLTTSFHPVSKGVLSFLSSQKFITVELENIKNIQAKGIKAEFKGHKLLGGNEKFLRENGIEVINSNLQNTLFYYAVDGKHVVTFELKDSLRVDAKDAILDLKKQGKHVVMLSGDNEKVCSQIAQELEIENFFHSLTPLQKEKEISSMQKSGKKVVMAGDGVNDILALSRADIGIAMGSGSDVAVDVGDVVLMNDGLNSLVESLSIGKRTYSLIKQNLTISLVYNAITIPLAMAGLIIPLIAALSMSFSSLVVVLNSMRIRS